ncbi:uncharacterized protein LOC119310852 [Triticum dicoccoides]|uniref:uncharacterized protein LOC119310852 n=1 Tax=Triticum dicoccoides TaxID=85692 RepID=UPI001890D3A5|nr:uncharacterized protein LOC119310852 [Triticum dicoccoides]
MDAPLPPPAYADGEQTDFVLIEKFGYLVDRQDATTATCVLQGPDIKGSIKVTFCAACPPRVSYFCVHATEYEHADFDLHPTILATEGPLVLLSVMLPSRSDIFHPERKEYFVYQAATKDPEGKGKKVSHPSLKHLPNPGRHHEFEEASAALLRTCSKHRQAATNHDHLPHLPHGVTLRPRSSSRLTPRPHSSSGYILQHHGANKEEHNCEACQFVIAAKRSARVRRTQHELCLYHSEKEAWSIKTAIVLGNGPYNHHWTDKAITIGGDNGVVAWVNLARDILFCDVLAETPILCPIELPLLIPESEGVGTGDPRCSRDVAIVDGFIHYTQLQIRIVPGSFTEDGTVTFDGWKATKCSMAIDTRSLPVAEKPWQHTGLELDSSQISKSLPNLLVDEGTIAFERLHIGLPTLSLSPQEDDIVYFLAKIDYRDMERTAYVLAVDLRKKMIKSIAEFGAKNTIGLGQAYVASSLSKYLKIAPGTKQKKKRRGKTPQGSSSKKKHPGGVSTVTCLSGSEVDYMALE